MRHLIFGRIIGTAAVIIAWGSFGTRATAAPLLLVSSPRVQQTQQQATQKFQGTIVKAKDKYILQDKASGATYQLDNQDKAKQFAGKDVKVTGTLDPSTNTIQVSDIQAQDAQ